MTEIISGPQCSAARALLGLSQAELAKLSGVSVAGVTAFEAGGGCLLTTEEALVAALQRKGTVFSDGGVRVTAKSERFVVLPGQNPSPETLRAALAIVNASRRQAGLPELRLGEEDQ
jgi:DNA-binding XRE family transcriptional regulator